MWLKSSTCADNTCVEVGACSCGDEVLVRDGKDPGGPVLTFTRHEWSAFLTGVKGEEFDTCCLTP